MDGVSLLPCPARLSSYCPGAVFPSYCPGAVYPTPPGCRVLLSVGAGYCSRAVCTRPCGVHTRCVPVSSPRCVTFWWDSDEIPGPKNRSLYIRFLISRAAWCGGSRKCQDSGLFLSRNRWHSGNILEDSVTFWWGSCPFTRL